MTQEQVQPSDITDQPIDQAIQKAIENLRLEGIQTITVDDVVSAAEALGLVVTPALKNAIADQLDENYKITGESGESWQWSNTPSDQRLTSEDLTGEMSFPLFRHRQFRGRASQGGARHGRLGPKAPL